MVSSKNDSFHFHLGTWIEASSAEVFCYCEYDCTEVDSCVKGTSDSDVTACCGTLQYNKTSHLCCGAEDVSDPNPRLTPVVEEATFGLHSYCCGLDVYDDRLYGCCDSFPYNVQC